MLEAQRYPSDLNGIVGNAPWADQTGFAVGAILNQKALSEAGVTPAKIERVAERVMQQCDAIDGLADGLSDDPRQCRFDARKDIAICGRGGAILPAQPGAKPADFNLAEGVIRYLVLDPPQSDYDTLTFDFARAAAMVARWSGIPDAKQTDLSAKGK